ncbi:Transmembrane [Hyphodiscus hymeniophilus]|uniref:Transmembrane n=1 Tax=Hyphodiscus hymeniophilus TaxID=353542 RepID=A0A9P7AZF8_9HELO|nr:Transmembrane [Hyphodiscus hymeniophilus]
MRAQDINFDIDHYLNRLIPRNRLHLLPKPVSYVLGYRNSSPPRIGNVLIWWWAFIGAFAGILVVEAVFHTEQLRSEGTPIVIASLGAAAILEYHTVESPFSQPRNAVLGQIFSAAIGISITKLFQHSPHFEALRWVAGALSVGVASAVMGITKTVHPPAGATALLCATSPEITAFRYIGGRRWIWAGNLKMILSGL